jgi:hypothetical protein
MAKVTKALLREAFIEPIRFALLLDDRFPIYSTLAENRFDAKLDNAKAKALFEFCRKQGWLCDIDNRRSVAEEFEAHKHLHQSDLLILDFNLDPADQNDPTAALKIIQLLAASDHFNLVVIYTTSDVDAVARDIVFSLGGGAPLTAPATEAARASLEDLDPEHSQAIAEALSWSVIDNYLKRSNQGVSATDLRKCLTAAQITGAAQTAMVDYLAFDRMNRKLKPDVLIGRRPEVCVDSSLGRTGTARWVTQGNVFIAIVNKGEEPNVLIDRLIEALEAWDPEPLRVMMMHARAAIERAGSLADQKVLETSRLQAGWLLHILLGTTDDERRGRISELYGRLFERLAGNVKPSITEFGMSVIGPGADDPVAIARKLAGAPHDLGAAKVFHALNEHLASDVCPDGPMTAGVIFRGTRGGAEAYWMCTSPACDLMPGQNRSGWDGELRPLRPASVIRMRIIKREFSVADALQEADRGRHVFLFLGGKEVAFQVIEEQSRQMELETILLDGDGLIFDGAFKGHIVERDSSGAPAFKAVDFQVLAKLRPDYANRILTQSGHQRSRIGVDFFNLPKPPVAEGTQ